MIAIFRHIIYGHTGTELPPPVIKTLRYVVRSKPDESPEEFRARVQELGRVGRQRLSEKPRKPYSCKDGLDWQIIETASMPEFNLDLLDRNE